MDRLLPFLFAVLAAALPAVLLLSPILAGEASFLLFHDAQEQTYAWWQSLAMAWHDGYLPLWDSHLYGGRSFVGEIQTAVFYPLTWLWLVLFSQPDGMPRLAIEGLIALHFSIASATMYGLLRHWGLGRSASLFGALCYALMGSVAERAPAQPNIFAGLCWLPLALWLTSRHLQSGRQRWAAAAGAVIGLQVLSGHAQPAFHTALLCGALCLLWHVREQSAWKARLLATLRSAWPMLALLLLVALPQWLLTVEYLSDVYRWVGGEAPIAPGESVPRKVFLHRYTFAPLDFLSLFDPWRVRVDDANTLHLGALGAALALWVAFTPGALSGLPLLQRHALCLRWVALFACLAMLGHLTPVGDVLRKLPLAGQIRELGRYGILIHVALCVFAAAGLHRLLSEPDAGSRRAAWVAAAALAVLGVIGYASGWLTPSAQRSLIVATVVLALAGWRPAPRPLVAAAAIAAVLFAAHLYRPLTAPDVAGKTLPEVAFAPIPLLAPAQAEFGRARIFIDDNTGLPKNYASVNQLQSRAGHSATMYRPYFDFLSLDWSLHSEVNDLLNIRYVLTREQLDLPLLGVDEQRGLRLYARPSAYPRVFLASRFRNAERAASAPDGFALEHYDDHELRFSLRLDAADTVVVSELDYPGWCAEVDGAPVPIRRARLAERDTPLRAIDLAAGEHRVRMRYRPFARWLGRCGRS